MSNYFDIKPTECKTGSKVDGIATSVSFELSYKGGDGSAKITVHLLDSNRQVIRTKDLNLPGAALSQGQGIDEDLFSFIISADQLALEKA